MACKAQSCKRQWTRILFAQLLGITAFLNADSFSANCLAQEAPAGSKVEAASATQSNETAEISEDQKKDLESFEKVWTTVRDKHFDATLNGVDWEAVRVEFRPKILEAKEPVQVRAILQEMLGRLGQTHFGIIPRDVYDLVKSEQADTETPATTDPGSVGFEVRIVNDQAIVTQVLPDSNASKAGIKPGWQLVGVNGDSVDSWIAKAKEKKAKELEQYQNLLPYLAVQNRLSGKVGESVALDFIDGNQQTVHAEVTRTQPRGKVASFGYLPATTVNIETERKEDIAIVRLNIFLDPVTVLGTLRSFIESNSDAKGFVIDLRGNPGGIGMMATSFAGWFVEKKGVELGTMTTRDAKLKFTVLPRGTVFPGPVAILVDELSMSTSEILAGGMQDIGRARIFGNKTPGAALPSTIERLPNGDGFQYAFANYVSADGEELEGHGITPDELILPERDKLLQGIDPVLEAAITWIRK